MSGPSIGRVWQPLIVIYCLAVVMSSCYLGALGTAINPVKRGHSVKMRDSKM